MCTSKVPTGGTYKHHLQAHVRKRSELWRESAELPVNKENKTPISSMSAWQTQLNLLQVSRMVLTWMQNL